MAKVKVKPTEMYAYVNRQTGVVVSFESPYETPKNWCRVPVLVIAKPKRNAVELFRSQYRRAKKNNDEDACSRLIYMADQLGIDLNVESVPNQEAQ